MMKPEVIELEGTKREAGRRSADKLRKDNRVPAVLYGPELKENIHFHIDELELEKILAIAKTKLQDLVIGGKTYRTLLKRTEYDPISDRPIHADFYMLSEGHPVSLRVPIRLKGNAIGVTEGGGRIFQPMRILRIKALPSAIPAQFEVDISHLNIGDAIHVSDLELEGITALDSGTRTIVTINAPKSESLFTTVADLEEEELEEGEALAEETAEGEADAAAGESGDETKNE